MRSKRTQSEEIPTTLDEAIDLHRQSMGQIANEHNSGMGLTTTAYTDGLSQVILADRPNRRKLLESTLTEVGKSVTKRVNETYRQVGLIVVRSELQIVDLLSPEDRALWERLQNPRNTYYSPGGASSYSAREAMQAGLDRTLWERLQNPRNTYYSPGMVSSHSATEAMKATLGPQNSGYRRPPHQSSSYSSTGSNSNSDSRQRHSSGARPQQEQSKSRKSEAHTEARRIVASCIARDRQLA